MEALISARRYTEMHRQLNVYTRVSCYGHLSHTGRFVLVISTPIVGELNSRQQPRILVSSIWSAFRKDTPSRERISR